MKIDANEIVCIGKIAITVRSYQRCTTVPLKKNHMPYLRPGNPVRGMGLKDGIVMITRTATGATTNQDRGTRDHE